MARAGIAKMKVGMLPTKVGMDWLGRRESDPKGKWVLREGRCNPFLSI
jgi:hypothetical protein